LDKIVDLKGNHNIIVVLIGKNAKRILERDNNVLLLISDRVQYEGGPSDLLNHPNHGKLFLEIKEL
jgi:ABC-type branched-subunit amino acid transport system ATPase component